MKTYVLKYICTDEVRHFTFNHYVTRCGSKKQVLAYAFSYLKFIQISEGFSVKFGGLVNLDDLIFEPKGF